MPINDSVWESVVRAVSLRKELKDLRKKDSRESERERNAIWIECRRKNQDSSVWVATALEQRVARTSRFLHDLCAIYTDVWKEMGNTESADFFRALGAKVIAREVRPRVSAETYHWNTTWERWNGTELSRADLDSQLQWFERSMQILESDWANGCESRAVICDAREQTVVPNDHAKSSEAVARTNLKRPTTHKPDPRKEAIRKICAAHREWQALQVCREMDRRAERNSNLSPLPSWCSRTWVDARKTHRSNVDHYISRARKAEQNS